jgi:hypothetical protein
MMGKNLMGTYKFMMGTYKFMTGTYKFMMGTYKFMMGTYKFMIGTYKFMMGTYKFMMSTYKFMMGTYKMQVMHKFVLVSFRCSCRTCWAPIMCLNIHLVLALFFGTHQVDLWSVFCILQQMGCPALGIWVDFLKQPALPGKAPPKK